MTTNARGNWSKEKRHKGPGGTTRSYSLLLRADCVQVHRMVSTAWFVQGLPVLSYKTVADADRAGREWIADAE